MDSDSPQVYWQQASEYVSSLSRMKKFQISVWVVAILVFLSTEKDVFLMTQVVKNPQHATVKKNSSYNSTIQTSNDGTTRSSSSSEGQGTTIPKFKGPQPQRNTPAPTIAPQFSSPSTKEPSMEQSQSTLPNETASPTHLPSPPTVVASPTTISETTPSIQKHPSSSLSSTNNFRIRLPPPELLGKTMDELPEQMQTFLQNNCDMQNVKEGWYPSEKIDTHAWKLRAPYLIVGGVWNSGVTNLGRALRQHPQIGGGSSSSSSSSGGAGSSSGTAYGVRGGKGVGTGLSGFFLPRTFYRYLLGGTGKVKVFAARERMYVQVYPKFKTVATISSDESDGSSSNSSGSNSNSSMQIAMDISPGYLFYAQQISKSIQCVSPWSKTVILLRNPVDRVYQQWVYEQKNLGLRLTLEDWIAQELKAMQSVGLLADTSSTTTTTTKTKTMSKQEERKAWKDYQSKRNLAGAIGRSMYVMQMEEWLETLEEAGKDPLQEVFLMRSELWETQPETEYSQLLEFLGLSPHTPSISGSSSSFSKNTIAPLKIETKQLLEDFFAPYNQRLATLLQQYGFNDDGDWNEPLWA